MYNSIFLDAGCTANVGITLDELAPRYAPYRCTCGPAQPTCPACRRTTTLEASARRRRRHATPAPGGIAVPCTVCTAPVALETMSRYRQARLRAGGPVYCTERCMRAAQRRATTGRWARRDAGGPP